MKRLLPALLASVLYIYPFQAIAEDPSILFLGAYQEFQEAESNERNGELRDALNRYSSTREILEKIKISNPDWQAMVVDYRLRKAKEGVDRLRTAIDFSPQSHSSGSIDPLQKKGFEIDIPAPKISTIPKQESASGGPLVVAQFPSSPDLGIIRELAEARAEISRLRTELTTAKAEWSSAQMEVEKVKTEMVAAKSTLAQAEDSLESATNELESLKAKADLPPDKKLLKLSSRIANLESENAFLKDDRERLTGKLRRASDYIRESEGNLAKIIDDRKSVAKERDKAISRIKSLKDYEVEAATLRNENEEFKKTIATTRSDLEASFQKAKGDLEQRLAKQDSELARMVELQRINGELAVQLERTEKALSVANEEKLGKANRELLQNELEETQGRLLALRAHIEGREAKTHLLLAQLDKTTSEMARLGLNPTSTPEHETLLEEGNLLREIILTQINEQNDHLKNASDLEKRIGELQAMSNELTVHLSGLSQPDEIADASFAVVKPVEEMSGSAIPLQNAPMPVPEATPTPDVPATPTPEPEPEPEPKASEPARAVLSKRQNPVPPELPKNLKKPSSISDVDRLMADGNSLEAEKILHAMVMEAPKDPVLLTNLAIAQLNLGRNTLSITTLKKVLEIKPGDIPALMNLANAHTRLGNVVEAARILQDVLKNDPNNAIAHNYLGISYGKTRGRHLEARESFAKSVELDKNYQNAHFNLAVAYARTAPTSIELAKKHYDMARKLGAAPDASLEKMLKDVNALR